MLRYSIMLFMFAGMFLHAQITLVPSGGSRSVSFPTERTGYKVDSDGRILQKTTNAGKSWNNIFTGFEFTTGYRVVFNSESNGYMLNEQSALFSTTDGGHSWQKKQLPSKGFITATLFTDHKNTAWAFLRLGVNSTIKVYTNSTYDTNWVAVGTLPAFSTINKAASFINENTGWYYVKPTCYKTTNGGITWDLQNNIPTNGFCIAFKDSNEGWIGLDSGRVSATSNGGVTWNIRQIFSGGKINDIQVNGNSIWLCNANGQFGKSSDGGKTWDTVTISKGKNFTNIYTNKGNWGYFGNESELYHYNATEPQFYPNRTATFVKDTVFTYAWESSLLKEFLIEYSTDNGRTWNLGYKNYPSNLKKFTWNVGSKKWIFRIRSLNPAMNLADSIEAYMEINRSFSYIAGNQVRMNQLSNGCGSYNPASAGSSGFYWPGGEGATLTAIFEDGLVFGGLVNGVVHVGGSTYRSGLQPGRILINGMPEDKTALDVGIWKIKRNWENMESSISKSQLAFNYQYWPGDKGAPFDDINGNGTFEFDIDKPKMLGDEVLWFAANDLEPDYTRFLYGTDPIGIEMQCTIFAVNTPTLENIVFKKYVLMNKSMNSVDSMFVGYWSDIDLGHAGDDFVGMDSSLNLMYGYNGDNLDDGFYGANPPAVGYAMLAAPVVSSNQNDSAFVEWKWKRGVRHLKMSSGTLYIGGSSFYTDPHLGVPAGGQMIYNNMKGLHWDGSQQIDRRTNLPVKILLSGDPVTGAGWYEGPGWLNGPTPDDRRCFFASGPFTLLPGEKQEVVFAIMIDSGSSNLNSITKLRELVPKAKEYYYSLKATNNYKQLTPIIEYAYELSQNYPNPFNSVTNIRYQIEKETRVTLKVYDILGSELATLVDEVKLPGKYSVEFSSVNQRQHASGVYFYRLDCNDYHATKKLILLK